MKKDIIRLINATIAKYCDWVPHEMYSSLLEADNYGFLGKKSAQKIPNYYQDLTACAEMRKKIPRGKVLEFDKQLQDIRSRGARCCDFESHPSDFIWHATAAEFCEAFLWVVGEVETFKLDDYSQNVFIFQGADTFQAPIAGNNS